MRRIRRNIPMIMISTLMAAARRGRRDGRDVYRTQNRKTNTEITIPNSAPVQDQIEETDVFL